MNPNEQKEWFETWFDSPFYNILYTHRDAQEAAQFVDILVQYLHPYQGARALDVGCGEGRHAYELSKCGLDVLGIDLSANRIAKAKRLAHEHLQFQVQDMRTPLSNQQFDFVFNFFTSFGYFEKEKDTFLAAKNFVNMLSVNGILVLDYLNTNISEKHLNSTEHIVRNGLQFDIRRKIENKKFIKSIDVTDEDNQLHHYKEIVAALYLEDFKNIFEPLGLQLKDTFGNYQLEAFDIKSSPRLIMIFEKGN